MNHKALLVRAQAIIPEVLVEMCPVSSRFNGETYWVFDRGHRSQIGAVTETSDEYKPSAKYRATRLFRGLAIRPTVFR